MKSTHDHLFAVISEALKSVDERLLILKMRDGGFVYPIYDGTSGMPTTRESFWIFLRGSGRPKQLDNGGPLPKDNLEVWPGDWGIAPVHVDYEIEDDVILQRAINAGIELVVAVDEQRVPA